MSNIAIHDWIPGEFSQRFNLVLFDPVLTVSELIELRVRQDVAEYNRQQYKAFSDLVQLTGTEKILNTRLTKGKAKEKRRQINADALVAAALDGFKSNTFILLVGERQIEDLDAVVDISTEPKITFIRLVPMVGG